MYPVNHSPEASSSGTLLKNRWIIRVFLFLTGLLAGLAVLFPVEAVWRLKMRIAENSTDNFYFKSYHIAQAEWNKVVIEDIELVWGNKQLYFSALTLKAGLSPMLEATLHTGGDLVLKVHGNRLITLSGVIDLGKVLNGQKVNGQAEFQISLILERWRGHPEQGSIVMRIYDFSYFTGGVSLRNIEILADFQGSNIKIHQLNLEGQISVISTGVLELDWDNPGYSRIFLTGELVSETGRTFFEHQGRIDELGLLTNPGIYQ